MLSVYWDETLPPEVKTPEDLQVERWDQWFTLCNLKEEWDAIKQACKDTNQTPAEVIRWAEITELTRLGGIASKITT